MVGLSSAKFGRNQDALHKLLGEKLKARNFQSQVNEIHACVAVLNRFTELGNLTPKLSLKFEWLKKNSAFECLYNKARLN